MPAALTYAHHIVQRLAMIRKRQPKLMPYLRPDAKSQVTLEYNDRNEIVRVDAIVVSTQHDPGIKHKALKDDVIENVIKKVVPKSLIDRRTKIHVNPTGQFIIGGPHGDTGLTGRKIIVDTYGGKAPHGGGAFSGKDPTKVDRSAAYAARHLAKNIVAAGIARECTIQVSYAIGVADPVSMMVNTHGTSIVPGHVIADHVMKNVDMTPGGIIRRLDLRRPIYQATASYGHFGRPEFPWENLELVDSFRKHLA
jgi:S-adenosylmethionine synthetase